MRVPTRRKSAPEEMAASVMRLDGLPLRPATARLLIGSLPEDPTDDDPAGRVRRRRDSACGLDPGGSSPARRTSRSSASSSS